MSTRNPLGPGCFRVAVQALAVLANADCACPSAAIAQDVEAHAVFLRRVLAQLARARIVEAREGRDGGYRLARPADQITLAEIYRAFKVGDPADEAAPAPGGNPRVHAALDAIGDEVDQRILDVFEQYTLASVVGRPIPTSR